MQVQLLSVEGKWYTATCPLLQRKCYTSTSAFHWGKIIHHHPPFITEKMSCEHNKGKWYVLCHRDCKYGSFLSSKNTRPLSKRKCFASTMPFSNKKILCDHGYFSFSENLMLTWVLCEKGKCLDTIYPFLTGKMVCENVSFVQWEMIYTKESCYNMKKVELFLRWKLS